MTNKLFSLGPYLKRPAFRLVLQTIEKLGHLSRTQLSAMTKLSPASITNICDRLISLGVIQEAGRGPGYLGRKPVYLETNPNAGYTIVLELCPHEVRFFLMDFCSNVRSHCTIPVTAEEPSLSLLSDLVRSSMPASGLSSCFCICIADNLGLSERMAPEALTEPLSAEFDLPVYYENGLNLTALAEALFHFSEEFINVLYLNIGETVRMSLITDGMVSPFLAGRPPKIGKIVEAHDIDGCPVTLDDMASLRYIRRQVVKQLLARPDQAAENPEQAFPAPFSYPDFFRLAQAGDPDAQETLRLYGRQLSRVIYNMVCLYNPDAVVIGGLSPDAVDSILSAAGGADFTSIGNVKVYLAHYGDVSVAKGGAKYSISRLLSGEL